MRHERDELVDDRTMLVDRHRERARSAAAPDLTREAWAAGLHRSLVAGIRAGADREGLHHLLDRLAHRPDLRVGAEVPTAGDATVAGHHDAGRLVGESHDHVRVGLVVAELDVERGRELLDPGVFEFERFAVVRDDSPLDAGRRPHHRAGAFVQVAGRLEVVAQPLPQVDRLADVEHPSARVVESVDAWTGRDLTGLGAPRDGVGPRHPGHQRAAGGTVNRP
jgi:hypothetical protein